MHEIFSPSSVVRHFPLSSQGRTCEKNQIFAVFQKQAIFQKFKIFRQNECTRFFSPSSVLPHFPLSSQGRTCEKIKFSPFFKNKQSFPNSRFLGKMSARDFFAVVSSPSFPSFVTGRTCEKNQIFDVFQKEAIFPKFKIFGRNECTSFFRLRRSSPSSVIRHFPLSSQGRTCEKNQIFPVFHKQAIFPKFKIIRQNKCTRFFRRRRSSPSLVVGHSLVRHREGPVKKIKFSLFFTNKQSFQNSRLLGKMSAQDFFAVVGRRRRRSSVISLFVTGTDL